MMNLIKVGRQRDINSREHHHPLTPNRLHDQNENAGILDADRQGIESSDIIFLFVCMRFSQRIMIRIAENIQWLDYQHRHKSQDAAKDTHSSSYFKDSVPAEENYCLREEEGNAHKRLE